MSILAVYLAPYDVEDDINLRLYQLPDDQNKDAIKELVNREFDEVNDETFRFWTDGGQFLTGDDDEDAVTLTWIFEIRDL